VTTTGTGPLHANLPCRGIEQAFLNLGPFQCSWRLSCKSVSRRPLQVVQRPFHWHVRWARVWTSQGLRHPNQPLPECVDSFGRHEAADACLSTYIYHKVYPAILKYKARKGGTLV
jgi:hypothetical protein